MNASSNLRQYRCTLWLGAVSSILKLGGWGRSGTFKSPSESSRLPRSGAVRDLGVFAPDDTVLNCLCGGSRRLIRGFVIRPNTWGKKNSLHILDFTHEWFNWQRISTQRQEVYTIVLNRTMVIVLVIIIALSCSWVCPPWVNCMTKWSMIHGIKKYKDVKISVMKGWYSFNVSRTGQDYD